MKTLQRGWMESGGDSKLKRSFCETTEAACDSFTTEVGVRIQAGLKNAVKGGRVDQPEVPSPQTPPHSLPSRRPAVTQPDSDI